MLTIILLSLVILTGTNDLSNIACDGSDKRVVAVSNVVEPMGDGHPTNSNESNVAERDYTTLRRFLKFTAIAITAVTIIWLLSADQIKIVEIGSQILQYLQPYPSEIYNHIQDLKNIHIKYNINLSNTNIIINIQKTIFELTLSSGESKYTATVNSLMYLNVIRAIRDNPGLVFFSQELREEVSNNVFRMMGLR